MHPDDEARIEIVKYVASSIVMMVAIGGIVLIELEAIRAHIDGKVLTATVGAICLIVGVSGRQIADVIRGRTGGKKK